MNWWNCIRIFNTYSDWVIPTTILGQIAFLFLFYFQTKRVFLFFKFVWFITLVFILYFKIIWRGINLRIKAVWLSWVVNVWVFVFGTGRMCLFLGEYWRGRLFLMVLLLLLFKLELVLNILWLRLWEMVWFVRVIWEHF